MGILEMTYVSYFFIVMAFVFGAAAVALYFVLDIRQCWRIVRGNRYAFLEGTLPFAVFPNTGQGSSGKTEKLAGEQTEALLAFEEALPPETVTLVQDIVMMDAVKHVNP